MPIINPIGPTMRIFHIGAQKNANDAVGLEESMTATTTTYIVVPIATNQPHAAALARQTNKAIAITTGAKFHAKASSCSARGLPLKL
jgi:ribosomal silencing factor RsfS